MGNIFPITARVLRAECSQNLQEPKKKKKKVMQTAMR